MTTREEIALLPCPFCGLELTRGSRLINPHARCRTEGCYGAKMPVVNLDVPESVAAWNKRALSPLGEPTEGMVEALKPFADAANNYADCADEKFLDDDATISVAQLRDARAALRASVAGWQDISTLPAEYKSGRKDFLVRFKSGHVDHVYLTVPEPPLVQTYRYCGGDMSGQQAGWPDSWMPLPTAPAMVAEDGISEAKS